MKIFVREDTEFSEVTMINFNVQRLLDYRSNMAVDGTNYEVVDGLD